MVQIKFVKEIPIINGTYKKDKPNGEIGYQKWQVKKTYEVEMEYEIVAKTKEEAEELLSNKEHINVFFVSTVISMVPEDPEEKAPKELKLPFFKLLKMLKLAKK